MTRTIHLWLGLSTGLVVFILGITGCIYSFSAELKSMIYKDRFQVKQVGFVRMPLSKLLPIAQASLGAGYPISRIQVFRDPSKSYQFRAIKIDKKAFGYNGYYQYYYLVYLDPYTGKVLYKENAKWELFTVSLALHMNLLLGHSVGHFVVRWSVVCFLILLFSGLVLWWPKNARRKQMSQALMVKWNGKFKRLNYDLHNVPGFYAFLPLILIALTGLMMSFELITVAQKPVVSDTTTTMVNIPADLILGHAISAEPSAEYYFFNIPVAPNGTANVSAYFSNINFYDRQLRKYDRYSGKLLFEADRFSSISISDQIKTINYDLHTGSVLGLPGKILGFLASLIATSLPITGLMIWLGKGKSLKKK